MPIFDDPRKSLEQLQKQLLQEEEEVYEEEYLTEEEWLDEELAEAKALLENDYQEADEDEELYRNFANGYGQYQQPQQYGDFEEDDEEEEAPASKVKGQLALTFVLLAGIVAVAVYWVAVLL